MDCRKRKTAVCGLMVIAFLGVGVVRAAGDGAGRQQEKDVSAFIPAGYAIAGRAEADFNHDRIADLVIVLQKQGGREETEGAPRWLVILFKRANGRYVLSLKSSRVAPASGSGLRSDEEFAGPWAVNDTFKIRSGFSDGHCGVTTDYQFRFRGGAWYLIGKRSEFLGDVGRPGIATKQTIGWSSRIVDSNFLTRDRVETWTCGDCADPQIQLILRYRDQGTAKTLHDYFEKSGGGGGMEFSRISDD